ncbi:hypothetical protein SAMN05660337_2853 [Maridesulfovibrio ferrireducens]|uniref:Uncharacterized protein n=1 Tax=Maridesulfovibrio ferrireducens TaxID=246191 RepID=A0A1G9JMX2_9BACT|nr:hypothetical protein [Maridesulfovibrio ferrireducens]SDL38363.1 hypothetical protein SAMN05660337_2853 [Maridesulfovibrio ferrireducens]
MLKNNKVSCLTTIFTFLLIITSTSYALAGGVQNSPEKYTDVFDLLINIFILATVIEVAFSIVFNWKIFLLHMHDKGWKVPIIVVTTFLFCKTANLHLVGDLVNLLFTKAHTLNANLDYFLSALLLAGGSGSVNTIFEIIKLRDPKMIQARYERVVAEQKATLEKKLEEEKLAKKKTLSS